MFRSQSILRYHLTTHFVKPPKFWANLLTEMVEKEDPRLRDHKSSLLLATRASFRSLELNFCSTLCSLFLERPASIIAANANRANAEQNSWLQGGGRASASEMGSVVGV